MQTLKNGIHSFANDESGQNLIEYALIAALVALAAIAAMTTLGTTIGNAFTTIGSKLTNAI